ncbi:MAG: NAD(P)-binding domain-containing protein [Planctomycetes bacterium]|nr:NAD(P)-binding domain-containing protein [Planctomycetota bacterium]MCB9868282.1 NAD(P)-binding domain-containing protein [Planctomycetota bacterium]
MLTKLCVRFWALLTVLTAPVRWLLRPYTRWLHTRWPAGRVEKLPEVQPNGTTNVAGLYVTGDLTGIPLLKFAADSGARAVQHIVADRAFAKERAQKSDGVLDLLIVGAGVSGMAAALEARAQGLDFQLVEGAEPFSTLVNFPRGKPIYTYPTGMRPAGALQLTATVKEPLLDELRAQTLDAGITPTPRLVEKVVRRGACLEAVVRGQDSILARRVIVAIGRSGNFRRLGVPGEDLEHVGNRLFDPKDYRGKKVLVVGGGDSAVESAIAIAECGGEVALSYRKGELSRPKPENLASIERLQRDPMARLPDTNPESDRVTVPTGSYLAEHRAPGTIELLLGTTVARITPDSVTLRGKQDEQTRPVDAVLTMIGREPPLDFFRRSGVKIRGETRGFEWAGLAVFFLLIWFVYDWKNHGELTERLLRGATSFPERMPDWIAGLGSWWKEQVADRKTVIGTVAVSMKSRSFYYTLVYTLLIGWFGLRRVLRRRTPYVTVQTLVLFLVQLLPLFLLPEIILPYLGYNGAFDSGIGKRISEEFFALYSGVAPDAWPEWGHPRAYWRAYGLVLAFPLFVYNAIESQPLMGWLILSAVQTFVLIPLLVFKWGKGAYCGWICSCGGLAETMGDAHRHKMFHGVVSNRANMVGQVVMVLAFGLLAGRIWTWTYPDGVLARHFDAMFWRDGSRYSYKWIVDVVMGGVLGVGFYFKYSGRIWCRFACPLAALMHIYARFSRFRIVPEKSKCISCNVCTASCHMGIDVMNFANKGMPMADPECVRCSACVQSCPTGTLQFGEVSRGEVRKVGWLAASPVLRAEHQAPEPPRT